MNFQRQLASATLRVSPGITRHIARFAADRASRHLDGVANTIAESMSTGVSGPEHAALKKRFARNIYDVNLMQLRLSQFSQRRLRHFIERVEVSSPRSLNDDLENGRPILFFSPHYQHYAISALKLPTITQTYTPLHIFYNPPSSNNFSAMMTTLLTTLDRGAVPILNDRRGGLTAMRTLKGGGALAIMPDFTQPSTANRYVPFFNRYFFAMPGTAVLALRSSAALYPIYCERYKGDRFVLTIEEALEPRKLPDFETNVYLTTMDIFAKMEEIIRRDVAAWRFWADFESFTWSPLNRPASAQDALSALRAISRKLRAQDPASSAILNSVLEHA